ncbi:MAG: hypothetical protein ACRC46_14590 [Thermoguttaceae bacterium]
MFKCFRCMLVLALCGLVVGCSQNVAVSGKATLADGTPLPNGRVMFQKDGFVAIGDIKPDGSYTMGTLKESDGLPRGDYVVFVDGVTEPGKTVSYAASSLSSDGSRGQGATITMPSFKPLVSPKHTKAETSDIKCSVTKSMKFDFSVEPAGK